MDDVGGLSYKRVKFRVLYAPSVTEGVLFNLKLLIMCLTPVTLMDGRKFSCGKCPQCHTRYIQHWVFRLQHEQRKHQSSVFLTLTYDYNHIPINKGRFTLDKTHFQGFMKRLRKRFPHTNLKYVVCGEYGGEKDRPHYHALIFGVSINDYNKINECWKAGLIHVGNVEPASIAYVFKYSIKGDKKVRDRRQQRQYVNMSKGLGEDFAFHIDIQKKTYIIPAGFRTDKQTGEKVWKEQRIITRQTKIRTPKKHFEDKLMNIIKLPYYILPKTGGGTVKMSIPRFYIKSSFFDTTELTEKFLDEMSKKYNGFTMSQKEVIYARSAKQIADLPKMQEKEILYSISKEKI